MRVVGQWLRVNGEAIYGSRPREGALWSEGETIRYTRSKDGRFVYAACTEWPGMQVVLKTVRPKVGSTVNLLGLDTKLPWSFDSAKGTTVSLPENLQEAANRPCDYTWILKFEAADM
jgi:alpha-L-fucosidase